MPKPFTNRLTAASSMFSNMADRVLFSMGSFAIRPLARACRAAGVRVVPVAGACAFVAALSASGLPSDSFLFAGFLPPKTSARKNFFEKYADFPHTLVFYESPYRIEKFIDDACDVLGESRTACVAKEISKIYERFFVGTLGDIRRELQAASTKGEFVAIIAPKDFAL